MQLAAQLHVCSCVFVVSVLAPALFPDITCQTGRQAISRIQIDMHSCIASSCVVLLSSG